MSAKNKSRPGRPSMKDDDKKKPITCMLSPGVMKRLKIDAIEGKALTPNQRLAQIVEMYYKSKDKKEKKSVA